MWVKDLLVAAHASDVLPVQQLHSCVACYSYQLVVALLCSSRVVVSLVEKSVTLLNV